MHKAIFSSSTAHQSRLPRFKLADEARVAVLRDGTSVLLRPIRPEDIELERDFIEALSPASRRFRFLDTMRSPSDSLLRQMTIINPSTDVAYVALIGAEHKQQEIGVARFSARNGEQDCEFAVTVADQWQTKGLGTLLMQRLIEAAKARGIASLHSSDTSDNVRMRAFANHLQLRHERDAEDAALVRYSLDVDAAMLVDKAVLP